MKKLIHIDGNDLYLSKKYLKRYASPKTIECWKEGNGIVKMQIENETFFLYKSIPYRTRKKLLSPDKIISQETKQTATEKVKAIFHEAYYFKFAQFKSFYENGTSFTTEQVTKFARLHSVFQAILDLKKNEPRISLLIRFAAFKDIFPGKYTCKESLSAAEKKATDLGVESVALDGRTYGNNDRSKRDITPQVDYIISALVASGHKYTCSVILEKANTYFKQNGFKERTLSWVKKERALWLKNPEIFKNRYGDLEAAKKMPYATMKHASVVLRQVQIDGRDIPFLFKGIDNRLHHLTLVYVIDGCSKKIIGYSIGDNEDGALIKEAIRKCIYNTKMFPNEIVMDNHSFTQTKAAHYFEDLMNKMGAIVTKTSNPQHKSIVERYQNYLDILFAAYPGFTGSGRESRSIDKKVSKENFTESAQNPCSREEIIAITIKVIEDYNNKIQGSGKTPNQLFLEKPNPNPILPNQFELAELLPYKEDKQIRRNQITIQRGIEKFEYQLPAALYEEFNDQIVTITYDELNEGIFMFDRKTGKGIRKLFPKIKINNAKAEQTEGDLIALYKNTGKMKGIKHMGKYKLEELTIAAHGKDPEIYAKLSPLLVQKSIIKDYQADSNSRLIAEENGIIINELHTRIPSIHIPTSLKPKEKDRNPFKAKANKIEMVDPLKLIDDNEDDE